ncbi:unnamed protein product, partial [Lymnaea stagnalis]
MADWTWSFDKAGHSQCSQDNTYIQGFEKSSRLSGSSDGLGLIDHARCCYPPSPWQRSRTQTVFSDWRIPLDSNNQWVSCHDGYFLQGFYRSGSSPGLLHNIEDGRCTKPADHPNDYGGCYDEDISKCFDQAGLCKCQDGYFVIGLHRGDCDNLYCLETLRCCKMAERPEALDELSKVKSRVMDTTMADIAYVAHYLGYGWCAGCRALYVGEDFRRDGDSWWADQSRDCDGYKHQQRLVMAYNDWGFALKDVKYGEPVTAALKPETIDSGTLHNNDATKAEKSIERSDTRVRSVTHTTTSSWKDSHELGLTISYQPYESLNFTGSYLFKYERSARTTDEKRQQQSRTWTTRTKKTLQPYTAVKWRVIMFQTRTTVRYTATVQMKFSAELRGFLRWGGGFNGPNTNYHYVHRGSGDRPTFNYKFGNRSVPFYTALKREAESNNRPWLWNDVKLSHPDARNRINILTNESHYEFKLTGIFEDVIGKNVAIEWVTIPLN